VLVLYIFSLLPVDCRLRCAEVCRSWRSVLLECSLWTRLDLSRASGVRVRNSAERGALDALLRCAAARACGGLQALKIDTCLTSDAALLEAAAANAGALCELHATRAACDDNARVRGFKPDDAAALLSAAPLLRVFAADLYGEYEGAAATVTRRALRNEAPFGPLRVRHLYVPGLRGEDEASVVALAADVAAHTSLEGLHLQYAPLGSPAALDAVVDAALARRLQSVTLDTCHLSPASAPALARLLSSDALTTLRCVDAVLLDAPAGRLLAAALRANVTLMSLTLINACVFDNTAAGAELLRALTGHASLRVLRLCYNLIPAAAQAAAGASLGALVAANAPALTQLDVWWCDLGDDGLRALFEALPRNAHLRTLNCYGNFMSQAFAADVLLPAVRANTSLRTLVADSTAEAEAVVASRAAA
jgi:hypothetical protein